MNEQTTDKVSAALVAAQAEMPAIPFDSTNPFLKNRYASLGSVISTSRPILAKHKLALLQKPTSNNGEVMVQTTVLHESGQSIDGGSLMLAIGDEKGKSRAQVAGSIITYLRRYAWASVLGLYADEDNDGNQPTRLHPPRNEYLPDEDEAPPPPPKPTPPAPGKLTPEAIRDKVLESLQAKPGQPNRKLTTDFALAAGVIIAGHELEQWPVTWLPTGTKELRALGLAIARFEADGVPEMPYAPHLQPEVPQAASTPPAAGWRIVTFHTGPLKGNALKDLPDDVLKDLWKSFEETMVKDADSRSVPLKSDVKLRQALNEAAAEKGWEA